MNKENKKLSPVMTAIVKRAAEQMELNARFYKDKGETKYTAEKHASSVGYCLKQALTKPVIVEKAEVAMEVTTQNLGDLFHALYNHSAWRQKFEKADIFPKATERSLAGITDELDVEMDGE